MPATITFEPWTDGYAVGFKYTHPDGRVQYVYLNPSDVTELEPGEPPTVFVYQGPHGAPSHDDSLAWYTLFDDPLVECDPDLGCGAEVRQSQAVEYRDGESFFLCPDCNATHRQAAAE